MKTRVATFGTGRGPRLVVGLGNPGERYAPTRHNVGFRVVRQFSEEEGFGAFRLNFSSLLAKGRVAGADVILLLPQTFMNRSGEAVREAKDFYRVPTEALLVVHDDIDLPLGRVKSDFDAGPAGHRGVTSVIAALGSQALHRVRIGIGRPMTKEEVEAFVLAPFTAEEGPKVAAVVTEAVGMIRQWVHKESL